MFIFISRRHVAVGWGVVEDTLKAEVERRKENVGKRVTKVIFQSHPFTFFDGYK